MNQSNNYDPRNCALFARYKAMLARQQQRGDLHAQRRNMRRFRFVMSIIGAFIR